jgi:hypothetical protein
MMSSKEEFSVDDKTVHMDLMRFILTDAGKVKDFTKQFRHVDLQDTYVYSEFFSPSSPPFITPMVVEGRSALSGRISRTHPYYDTFVNMDALQRNVPDYIGSQVYYAKKYWTDIVKEVFEKVDIEPQKDCVVQLKQTLSTLHPHVLFAMFERLAIVKINNKDPVLRTLAESVRSTDELEYRLRQSKRENEKLKDALKGAENVKTCKTLTIKFMEASKDGEKNTLKAIVDDMEDIGCEIPKTSVPAQIFDARKMQKRTRVYIQNKALIKKEATNVENAIENTADWNKYRQEAISILKAGNVSQSMRERLNKDKQIIDALRSVITRHKAKIQKYKGPLMRMAASRFKILRDRTIKRMRQELLAIF